MRSALLLGTIPLLFYTSTPVEEAASFAPVENSFPLHWKTQMGNVTFRSNFILTPNEIIIGSNGENYMDYQLSDKKSGVYVLNRKNGNIIKHFGNEVIGDMDVTGLVQFNNRIYYGNDNEEVVCATKAGKEIWIKPASGDIEHEPALIYHQQKPMIVYATETGEVRAVKPDNGNTIWQFFTPDFEGWKPGDNRAAFKVKSYLTNTYAFFTKPVISDLNGDGTDDLIYSTRAGDLYAINGANGRLLWKRNDISVYAVYKIPDAKNLFACVGTPKNNAGSINYLFKINNKGQNGELEKIDEGYFGQISAYFSEKELLLNSSEYVYFFKDFKKIDSIDRRVIMKKNDPWDYPAEENRNYPDILFSNISFNYKQHGKCIIGLVQNDRKDYKQGFIEIISLTNKQIIERFSLPESSEMNPWIEDINKDGKLDLLVNCRDGNLYCYDLGVKER